MLSFLQSRTRSFGYAFSGLGFLFKSEANFRIHLVAAVLVVLIGIFLGINRYEWCIALICMAMVMAFEAVNTAIEKLADKNPAGFDPNIARIKDMAASAVLVAAIISAIIAAIIFYPYLAALIHSL